MALGEWGVRKCPLWEVNKGQNEGQKGENMAMPPHKPSVFAGCRNKQQKTAWLRGFLPKYLFGFPRMAEKEGFEPSRQFPDLLP